MEELKTLFNGIRFPVQWLRWTHV